MHKLVVLLLLTMVVAACGKKPDLDLSECRFDLAKMPNRSQMADVQRFHFLDTCMEAKGWFATSRCKETTMQGTQFCTYERR